MGFLDLYLIHWPATSRRGDSWRALGDMYDEGLIKAVGVSNYTIRHLEEVMNDGRLIPMVNQVEFHPFIYDEQRELLSFCTENQIIVEAYSPLARITKDGEAGAQTIADKHGVSLPQVFLRWCLQHGTVPLPRSKSPEHIRENIDVFDFRLDDDDMKALNTMSDGARVTWDPEDMQ
jgi:diketogulonate reductase-like aldo/keto reductase